jgi:hypothetical protein
LYNDVSGGVFPIVLKQIVGNFASGLIKFSGGTNYIIDDSNNGTSTRNLSIENTSSVGAAVVFEGTAANLGVSDVFLQNCKVKSATSGTTTLLFLWLIIYQTL